MIVDPDDILVWLGFPEPTTAQQSLITLCHERGERLIKGFVGYEVEQASLTEYLPRVGRTASYDSFVDWSGGGVGYYEDRSILYLGQLPVRAVQVWERTDAMGLAANFTSTYLLVEQTDYSVDWQGTGLSKSGILRKIGSTWPLDPRSVKVTYTAGYTEAELLETDFPYATMLTVQKLWNQVLANQGDDVFVGSGAIVRERTEGLERWYNEASAREQLGMSKRLPSEVEQMLMPLKRMDIVTL